MGWLREDSVEGARAEAGGFAAIAVGGVGWALTSGDGWGYAIAAVAAFRVVLAARTWRRLAKVRSEASTVGAGRFAGADKGFDPLAVDTFWRLIDSRSIEELQTVDFPESEPGYDTAQVHAALSARIAERRRV